VTGNGVTGNELGASLRQWRDRVDPASVAVNAFGSRRSPGLRREELAMLSGVSADYVTRLEQGRASNPSVQVLSALARVLQLSAEERAYLFQLANQPVPAATSMSRQLTPGVQRLLERLDDVPVAVFDAGWTLLAWNPGWAALMGEPPAAAGRDRNLLWRYFLGGEQAAGRVTHTEEQRRTFEESTVADLRSVAARYLDDDELHRLITDLIQQSPRFAALWQARAISARTSDRKRIDHPELGPVTLDCDVLTVQGSDLRVVAYTAEPGSPDADKLALLGVVGQHQRAKVPGVRLPARSR
jgi:transcriptional regulator with XRE-family HTH domain